MEEPERSRAEFEAEKNNAYASMADLIEEHGYEPTIAAAAELLSRRVKDDMRSRYTNLGDPRPDGGYATIPAIETPWPYFGAIPIFGVGWAVGAASFLLSDDVDRWPPRVTDEARACIVVFTLSHALYLVGLIGWWLR